MATRVRYNTVVIENCQTREWRQECVYDSSATDPLYTKYTITVEGIVSGLAKGPRTYLNSRPVDHATESWRMVRQALLEPRRTLEITHLEWILDAEGRKTGEREIPIFRCVPSVDGYDSDPDRDLANGPKPIALRATKVIGSRAIRVEWTVECARLEGPLSQQEFASFDGWGGPQTVLSNRWSVDESFDENFFCTRTIRGTLVTSAAVAKLGWDYRWLATPPLEAGFRRVSVRYTIQPNGLEVQYEVTDRQVHTAAPWPATRLEVRHSRYTQQGTLYGAACDVQIEGPPHIPKAALLQRLVQVLDFYLGILRNRQTYATKWLINSAEITEEVGQDNRLQARVAISILSDPTNPQDTSLDMTWVAKHLTSVGRELDLSDQPAPAVPGQSPPPGMDPYNPHMSWPPSPWGYNPWGTARHPLVAAMLACYLQRPYRPPHGIGDLVPVFPPEDGEKVLQDVQVQEVSPGELAVADQDRYSDEHRQAVYTYARMVNRYRIMHGWVGLPLTAPSSGATTALTQLAYEGIAHRTLIYDAERLNEPPEVPAPYHYQLVDGTQAKLARYTIEPLPPVVAPSGDGLLYRVRARYEWILDRLPALDRHWPTGRLPHVRDESLGFDPGRFTTRLGPLNTEQ